jgi:hypothetical protein
MDDYVPHGGLTHSGGKGGVWWFGFDTAHGEDFLPGLYIKMRMVNHGGKSSWPPTTNYRTWEFVDAEIRKMMEAIALKRYTIEEEKGD